MKCFQANCYEAIQLILIFLSTCCFVTSMCVQKVDNLDSVFGLHGNNGQVRETIMPTGEAVETADGTVLERVRHSINGVPVWGSGGIRRRPPMNSMMLVARISAPQNWVKSEISQRLQNGAMRTEPLPSNVSIARCRGKIARDLGRNEYGRVVYYSEVETQRFIYDRNLNSSDPTDVVYADLVTITSTRRIFIYKCLFDTYRGRVSFHFFLNVTSCIHLLTFIGYQLLVSCSFCFCWWQFKNIKIHIRSSSTRITSYA